MKQIKTKMKQVFYFFTLSKSLKTNIRYPNIIQIVASYNCFLYPKCIGKEGDYDKYNLEEMMENKEINLIRDLSEILKFLNGSNLSYIGLSNVRRVVNYTGLYFVLVFVVPINYNYEYLSKIYIQSVSLIEERTLPSHKIHSGSVLILLQELKQSFMRRAPENLVSGGCFKKLKRQSAYFEGNLIGAERA